MKDLTFTCTGTNGQNIYCAYNTIMDFLEEKEKEKIADNIVNASNFNATFFENKLNTFACDTLDELYNHCELILR